MSRKGLQRITVIIFVALCVGTLASASQLHLTPMLKFYGEHSDNVFFTAPGTEVSDFYYLIGPGVNVDYASSRAVLSLGFQAGFHRFTDFDMRNNEVYRLDVNGGVNVSNTVSIKFMDNYIKTNDPLAFDASGDRLQRDSFWYNRFSPGLALTLGGNKVQIQGAYERIDVDYDSLVDSVQNGFHLGLDTKVGRKTSIGINGGYFERKFDFTSPLVDDYKGRRIKLALDHSLSPNSSFQLFGGHEWRDFENEVPTVDYDDSIFGVSFNGEYPGALSFHAEFSQRLNDLTAKGVYRVRRFALEAKKVVGDRVTATGSFFMQKAFNEQLGPNERDEFAGFRVQGDFLVVKFLTLDVGYEYLDRESNILNDFTENKIFFGLVASYGL